jgi:hypothetical protein
MQTLLDSLWKLSNADDANKSARLEQAGYYYKDPITGESTFIINTTYGGSTVQDACNSWPGAGQPGWDPAGVIPVHTHPFDHTETTPTTNCHNHAGGLLVVPGPSGPDVTGLKDEGLTAGVVIDKEKVYRFKPDGTQDKIERKQKKCTYP